MQAHTAVTWLAGLVSCFATVHTQKYTETDMLDTHYLCWGSHEAIGH